MALAPGHRTRHEERPSRSPHGIELKFQLSPEQRVALEACPPLAAENATRLHQVTTYFDTPDAALIAAGFTLRVRSVDGRYIQTIKSRDGDADLAAKRNERESRIASAVPNLSRLGEIPQLGEMVEQIAGGLEPMFVTDVERTVRTLSLGAGCTVEVAIDVGAIQVRQTEERICEVELELKAGPPGPMYRLASTLQACAPMWLSTESKATRGWHLRTGQTAAIRLATIPKLDHHVDATDGFRQILGAALEHLTANIGATLRGDPEGLHQMRIALRAARATLLLFSPSLDIKMVTRFDGELQTVCRAFGIARDWDVFCVETLPDAMRDLPAARLLDLGHVADISRAAAHRSIEGILRGAGFTATLLALASWAEPASDDASGAGIAPIGRSLPDLAPKLLCRVARDTRKRGRHVTRLSPEGLHRFRKALDRLCDDSIALAALFPGRRVSAYRTRCVALQGILGVANDAVVARAFGRGLALETRPDLAAPIKALLAWSKARRTTALTGLRSATRDFRSVEPFWT